LAVDTDKHIFWGCIIYRIGALIDAQRVAAEGCFVCAFLVRFIPEDDTFLGLFIKYRTYANEWSRLMEPEIG